MSNNDFRQQYWARIEEIIARVGWAVQGVFPTEQSPGPFFCYSMGLHDQALPEVLVFGLPPEVGHALVNDVARYLMARKLLKQPLEGKFELENWPMPAYLVTVDPVRAREFATGANSRSDGAASYLQIVWPSKEGHFPWDAGASVGYLEAQIVLGQPA
jgi:hypothetical protein